MSNPKNQRLKQDKVIWRLLDGWPQGRRLGSSDDVQERRLVIIQNVPFRALRKGCCMVARMCACDCSVVSDSDPVDCSPPGSFAYRIFQVRMLEWVAISFSRRYFWSRGWTHVSCIVGGFFTFWAIGVSQVEGKAVFKKFEKKIYTTRFLYHSKTCWRGCVEANQFLWWTQQYKRWKSSNMMMLFILPHSHSVLLPTSCHLYTFIYLMNQGSHLYNVFWSCLPRFNFNDNFLP